jgi:hypothetical protein
MLPFESEQQPLQQRFRTYYLAKRDGVISFGGGPLHSHKWSRESEGIHSFIHSFIHSIQNHHHHNDDDDDDDTAIGSIRWLCGIISFGPDDDGRSDMRT